MDKPEDKTEIHVYDDIEEHDNPIPFWFTALFLSTVLFGMGYYGYYELGEGESLKTSYERAVFNQKMTEYQHRAKTPLTSEEDLYALTKDPEKIKSARAIYQSKCVSCHADHGQGGIGPNLADSFWIHGGKLAQIRDTIANGVLDKGMPPWSPVLTTAEVNGLTAFVRTLQGTHPSGAKEPQGVLVKLE